MEHPSNPPSTRGGWQPLSLEEKEGSSHLLSMRALGQGSEGALDLKPLRGWGALEEQPLGEVWVLPEQVPARLFVHSSRCFLQTAPLHPAVVGRENPHLA